MPNGDRVITNDATGNTTTVRPDGSAQIKNKNGKTEELPAGTVPPTTPPPKTKTPLRGEDQHDPAAAERFLKANPAIAEQLRQSKSGTNGDVDPNPAQDNFTRGVGVVAPSASVQQKNLVGQPGQKGGLGESGAPKTGLDFNGNLGATDLGPDSTVSAGNRQQGADEVFGDQHQLSISDARKTPTPTPAPPKTPKNQ